MDDDFQELRKRKDNLLVSGFAVLIAGIWDVVKFAMAIIMNPKMLLDAVQYSGIDKADEELGEVMIVIVFGLIVLVDVLIRSYITRSARAEARGKRKGWLYLIVAAVMVLALSSSLYNDLYNGFIHVLVDGDVQTGLPKSWDSVAASGLMDLISIVALVDIIVSSFIVKRIDKKDNVRSGEDI